MRKFVLAAAMLAVATPAMAQPGYDDWDRDGPAAYDDGGYDRYEVERYDPRDHSRGYDSRAYDHAAGTLDRLVGAIMDLRVGGIAAAVDPLGRGGIYPRDTVRDLTTRNDPYAEARIRSQIQGTARGMRAMNRSVERMMPALRDSYEALSRDLRIAIDNARDAADDY